MRPWLCVLLFAVTAHAELYTITGGGNTASLVIFNSETLLKDGGSNGNGGVIQNDLTIDPVTGRLFAMNNSHLLEFNPITLQLINSNTFTGAIRGVAARNNIIYGLTGGGASFSLVTFDADTLTKTGGDYQSGLDGRNALAFDESGRLFALSNGYLAEFDPITLTLINQSAYTGPMMGLAARNGTVYSLSGDGDPSLVTFSANTLTQTGGLFRSGIGALNELAFDSSGRLYGRTNNYLAAFDPITLTLQNQQFYSNITYSLAANLEQVPEPSVLACLAVAGIASVLYRRRQTH